MLPHSEHMLFKFLLRLSCTVFGWLEYILQYCVKLEAKVFFPSVAFEISPITDFQESKTREHLPNMPLVGEKMAVDTRVVVGEPNQITSIDRHKGRNGPRTRRRELSLQAPLYGRAKSTAPLGANLISWGLAAELKEIDLEHIPWQDYEIPEELTQILANTPTEILNIVRESIDSRRALKASISAVASNPVSSTTNLAIKSVSLIDQSTAGSSTATVSQRAVPQVPASTAGSASPSVASSPNRRVNLTPTFGFSTDDESRKSPQMDVPLQALGPRDTVLCENLKAGQAKLQKHRPKLFKDHGLARLFRHRNNPRPERESPEPAESESTIFSECASCFEDIPGSESASLACQHSYCSSCFLQLVKTAMKNENFFPPKCCLQEIPRATIRAQMPVKDFAQFDEKAQEYAVPTGSRWYCSSPQCGKWIKTGKRPRSATLVCPHCRFSMCTSCRGPKHSLTEYCPEDRGLGATLREAEREGWRRCYNCRSMVELATGCRHITCKCKAEFWYVDATSIFRKSTKYH